MLQICGPVQSRPANGCMGGIEKLLLFQTQLICEDSGFRRRTGLPAEKNMVLEKNLS